MFLKSNASAVLNIASFQSKGFLTQTMSTLRVLGVPGHGQTAKAFREKSGCVRGKLKNKCEFVYIEPPFHLEPCDHGGWSRTWLIPFPAGEIEKEEEVFYHGIEHSMALLTEIILTDKVDAIAAFSMGSALSVLFLLPFEKLQTHFQTEKVSMSKIREEHKLKLAHEDYVFESDGLFDINNKNMENKCASHSDHDTVGQSDKLFKNHTEADIHEKDTQSHPADTVKTDKKAPRFIPKLDEDRFTKAVRRLRGISFFSGFFFWKNTILLQHLRETAKNGFPPIINVNLDGRFLRTYHSYGTDDAVIFHEKSEELWRACGGRSEDVFVHQNGHLIYSKAKNSFSDFIINLKD